MPIIVTAEQTKVTRRGEGWQEITLADARTIGAPAMVTRRWMFDPGVQGPELIQGETDQLLYVVRGSGKAIVDDQTFPLSDESVLWLEADEQYCFIAGPDGLEILQGYAPGE